MRTLARLVCTAACVLTLVLTSASSSVFADDPTPLDPTTVLTGGLGGPPPPPSAADPDVWWNNIIPLLQALFPEATYEELCVAALIMYNLLPPETFPESPPDPCEPPPETPPSSGDHLPLPL